MQEFTARLNERAVTIVREMVANRQALGLETTTLPGGSRVLDAGVHCPGSIEAGRLLAEACLGGLGRVDLVQLSFPGFWLPGIQVTVQLPAIACLASQCAGWSLKDGNFTALGSGPARALAAKEEVFQIIDYREQAEQGVLALETGTLPPDQVACQVAAACGLEPRNLWLLVAPTASLAGSVQVAARVVETGLHKLLGLGYDITRVTAATGTCPLAPVAQDDLNALGRTNDAVLYGGRCFYTVNDPRGEIRDIVNKVPSSASWDYGTPFIKLFNRYGDFYKIDPLLFSPAEVMVNNLATGKVYRAGYVKPDLLQESLLGGGKP